ncbi:MAG: hypothetical protein K1W14_01975 [Muribaculaceae bacterium]
MKDRKLDRDRIDFANDKIGPLFRALFFPTLIGMIFNSALTVIDGIFVGQGVGANGIAAVNIVAPIYMIATGIGLMFGIGSSVVASIRLSENNDKAARIIMTQAFTVGLVIISLICFGALLCPHPFLKLLGCTPMLESNATDYLLWILPGLFFLFIQCVGMMLIRLDGSPKYAMTVQIVGAVINIALDWYMIFPLGLGVKGAAIATSIACIIAGLMVLAYFVWFPDRLRFYRIKTSVTAILTGRVNRTLKVSLFTAVLCGIIVMVGLWGGKDWIVRMFLSPEEPAYSMATSGLPLFSICAIFFAVNIAFIGYYQSIEKALLSTIYTMLRGIIFLVPSFILLPQLTGVAGLWLAIPCAEVLTSIMIITRYTISQKANDLPTSRLNQQ